MLGVGGTARRLGQGHHSRWVWGPLHVSRLQGQCPLGFAVFSISTPPVSPFHLPPSPWQVQLALLNSTQCDERLLGEFPVFGKGQNVCAAGGLAFIGLFAFN